MIRRIFPRPVLSSVMASGFLAFMGGGVALAVAAGLEEPALAVMLLAMLSWFGFILWLIWRSSHVRLSSRGVVAGFWGTSWLAWSDVEQFGRVFKGLATSIVAETADGEMRTLCGVSYFPLLDELEDHDRVVEATLAKLEKERQRVLSAG